MSASSDRLSISFPRRSLSLVHIISRSIGLNMLTWQKYILKAMEVRGFEETDWKDRQMWREDGKVMKHGEADDEKHQTILKTTKIFVVWGYKFKEQFITSNYICMILYILKFKEKLLW